MTQAERHKYILDKLHDEGFVSVTDLSQALNVTVVTVRRDLGILEEKGLLYRSHGSATLTAPYVADRSVSEKKLVAVAEKMKIAELAAGLVEPKDSLIIGSGTTVVNFAQALPRNRKLTVLTAAMNVTAALMDAIDIEIVQIGGVVRRSSSSVVGHFAEDMIRQFACAKLFLSADGLGFEHGLTTSHMMEANLNRIMMRHAQKTYLLIDSSKFGKKSFGKICDLEAIDVLITDPGIPDVYKEKLEELGVEVKIAY
ncbi:MAG: DeoR/GlpR family DNA-binding transcription regulator [Nitritalea sp.]